MLILLSPAKSLNESAWEYPLATQPQFLKLSLGLVEKYRLLSSKELQQKMKISATLADLNVERFREWSEKHTIDYAKPALLTFNGAVYKDILAEKFNEKQMKYAQKHVRILSGLYGVLRAFDLIEPYRLEMHHEVKFLEKAYW